MSPQKGGIGRRRRVPVGVRAEPLEGRALLAEMGFGVSDGRNVVARLAPAPGVRVSVSMTGPGTGAATVGDGGRVDLRLEGTTEQTVVNVKSAGRTAVTLGRLDLRSPLGALRAPTGVLSGDLSLDHAVGELTLGLARNLTIDAAGVGLGLVSAVAWTDDAGTPRDRITADSLAGLNVGPAGRARKARGPAVVSEFAADLDVPRLGTVAVAGNASLNVSVITADAIVVAGNLGASKISVMPTEPGQEAALGRLVVGGRMEGVTVVALGDVGAVTTRGMFNTDILAGVRYGKVGETFEHVLPNEHAVTGETVPKDFDFVGAYRIGSVVVTGTADTNARPPRRVQRPDSSPFAKRPRRPRIVALPAYDPAPTFAFGNSRVAAYLVGDVALEGVGALNATRDWGVAAYSVGRVLRRFAQPGVGTERFFIRQTSEPLVIQEASGGVGGYFGNGPVGGMAMISIVDQVVDQGGFIGGSVIIRGGEHTDLLPYIDIPVTGVSVGHGSVGGLSPTLYLMQDGSYELRVGSEAPLARGADMAAVVRAVVAAASPGTPVKVVHRPSDGVSPASITFRGTSVGPSVTLLLPAAGKPYRHVVPGPPNVFESMPGSFITMPGAPVETFYTLPSVDQVRSALVAGGTETVYFDKELLLVKPEGMEVGRTFDDAGMKKILLTAENRFRLVDAAGAVAWEGDDLLSALGATAPRLGARRLPVRLVGRGEVALHGLARGGSAYFGFGGRLTLDPAGNVNTLPDGPTLADRLRQAGIDFTGHRLA